MTTAFDDTWPASGLRPVRLPFHLRPGTFGHRSGWPHALEHLKTICVPSDLVLDDFVDRTFQHDETDQTWEQPWVGIFHHPPGLPAWLDQTAPPDVILGRKRFLTSLPHLRGAIVLSEYFADWLRRRLPGLPVLAVRLPSEIPEIRFSPDAWRSGGPRRVVQTGWYGRNVRAIHQVQAPPGMSKLHVMDDKPWIRAAAARIAAHSPTRNRPETGAVETCGYVDNLAYDRLLADSVVLAEYFDVSASNTVVECIARATPVLVNRLPALEEYLGRDYPLFYHDIETAGRHLADPERLEAAHHHLVAMDRSWLSARGFARTIEDFLARL
jgi:hypothetical protein